MVTNYTHKKGVSIMEEIAKCIKKAKDSNDVVHFKSQKIIISIKKDSNINTSYKEWSTKLDKQQNSKKQLNKKPKKKD